MIPSPIPLPQLQQSKEHQLAGLGEDSGKDRTVTQSAPHHETKRPRQDLSDSRKILDYIRWPAELLNHPMSLS